KLPERASELHEFFKPNPEPAHSSVDFEMKVNATAQFSCARIQLFRLIETINRRGQVSLDHIAGLPAPETAETENRTADARLTQFNSLFNQRHAEPIRID